MKAQELRIGNWVQIIDIDFWHIDWPTPQIPFQWELEHFLDLHECEEGFSEYLLEGIPLTEEWLEKFGFANKYNDWKFNAITNYVVVKSPFDGFIMRLNGGKVRLKHVHQLQNLWRSLTGQELEIKQ